METKKIKKRELLHGVHIKGTLVRLGATAFRKKYFSRYSVIQIGNNYIEDVIVDSYVENFLDVGKEMQFFLKRFRLVLGKPFLLSITLNDGTKYKMPFRTFLIILLIRNSIAWIFLFMLLPLGNSFVRSTSDPKQTFYLLLLSIFILLNASPIINYFKS